MLLIKSIITLATQRCMQCNYMDQRSSHFIPLHFGPQQSDAKWTRPRRVPRAERLAHSGGSMWKGLSPGQRFIVVVNGYPMVVMPLVSPCSPQPRFPQRDVGWWPHKRRMARADWRSFKRCAGFGSRKTLPFFQRWLAGKSHHLEMTFSSKSLDF